MRVAFIGDRHVSQRSPRYAHALDVWAWAVEDALREAAEVIVHAGDACEQDPNGTERYAMGRIYRRSLDNGAAYEILGNHESREAHRWLEFLGVTPVWDRILECTWGPVMALLIPYPRRNQLPFGPDPLQTIRAAVERAMGFKATGKVRWVIAVIHGTVEGMRTRDTEFEVHSAKELVIPRAVLSGLDLTITGHIHRAQVLPREGTSGPVVCVGSAHRVDFAEAEDTKVYVMVDFPDTPGDMIGLIERPIPAREMVQWTLRWDPAVPPDIEQLAAAAAGKEAKITLECPQSLLSTVPAGLFAPVEAAAAYCVVNRKTIGLERQSRAPQMARATSLGAELGIWMESLKDDPSIQIASTRKEQLVSKLDIVQAP